MLVSSLISFVIVFSSSSALAAKSNISNKNVLADKKLSKQADLIRKLKRENAVLKKALVHRKDSSKEARSKKVDEVNQAVAFSEKLLFQRFKSSFEKGEKANYRKALKLLARNYPKSHYFADVYFLAGKSALSKKKYKTALRSFNKVMKKYPKSKHLSAVMYSKAYTYQEMKLNKNALSLYKEIQRRFPSSSEAYRANLQIKRLAKK